MTSPFDSDPFFSTLMDDDPTPVWPPPGYAPRVGMNPTTEWVDELLRHGRQLPSGVVNFPELPAVQEVEHRGVVRRVVLLGVRVRSYHARPPMLGYIPRVADGSWGGLVEVDGRDLLDRRDRWVDVEDGRKAASAAYDMGSSGLTTTLAVAISAVEGMKIARFVVGRNGGTVEGSVEQWVVEAGEVRTVGR